MITIEIGKKYKFLKRKNTFHNVGDNTYLYVYNDSIHTFEPIGTYISKLNNYAYFSDEVYVTVEVIGYTSDSPDIIYGYYIK